MLIQLFLVSFHAARAGTLISTVHKLQECHGHVVYAPAMHSQPLKHAWQMPQFGHPWNRHMDSLATG
jgi:hypothetical protein